MLYSILVLPVDTKNSVRLNMIRNYIFNCICKSIAVISSIYLSLVPAGGAENCSIPNLNWQVGSGEIDGHGLTFFQERGMRKHFNGKWRVGRGYTQPKHFPVQIICHSSCCLGLGLC